MNDRTTDFNTELMNITEFHPFFFVFLFLFLFLVSFKSVWNEQEIFG